MIYDWNSTEKSHREQRCRLRRKMKIDDEEEHNQRNGREGIVKS